MDVSFELPVANEVPALTHRLKLTIHRVADLKMSPAIEGWFFSKPFSVLDVSISEDLGEITRSAIWERIERNPFVFVRGVNSVRCHGSYERSAENGGFVIVLLSVMTGMALGAMGSIKWDMYITLYCVGVLCLLMGWARPNLGISIPGGACRYGAKVADLIALGLGSLAMHILMKFVDSLIGGRWW